MAKSKKEEEKTSLEKVTETLSAAFKGMAEQMQQLGNSLQRVVTMGLAATNEGNRLAYAWTLFSRQIASVFLPTINFVIDKLQQMTLWFRSLTGDQQRLIESLGSMALVFAMMAPVLTLLTTVLSPLNLLIAGLASALYAFFTQTDAGKAILDYVAQAAEAVWVVMNNIGLTMAIISDDIDIAIASVLACFAGLGLEIFKFVDRIVSYIPFLGGASEALHAFVEEGQAEFDKLVAVANKEAGASYKRKPTSGGGGSARTDVTPSGFAFESLTASFERITSAANKQDIARDTLAVARRSMGWLEIIADEMRRSDTSGGGGADY